MKTKSNDGIAEVLRRTLPGITTAEIKSLKDDEIARNHFKMTQSALFGSIVKLFYKHDPESVTHDLNDDFEYDGEVTKVLQKLPECASEKDCQRIIYDVLFRAFDGRVKPLSHYAALANDVWQVWRDGCHG